MVSTRTTKRAVARASRGDSANHHQPDGSYQTTRLNFHHERGRYLG
jgi:hypothetical protein